MKKQIFGAVILVAAAALVMLQSSPSMAGDYHTGAGLICSDCHTMHYYEEGVTPPPGADAGGPFDKLLMKTSTNNLCLSCHDGATGADGAPDVLTTAGADHATNRGAGAFRSAVATTSVSGHQLGVVADAGTTPPGGTWSVPADGLDCADCHEPHGTTSYRNLKLRPGGVGADIPVTDVSQTALTPTATQYNVTNIKYGADANNNPDYSNWCAGCHTSFNATVADQAGAAWTNDANIGGDDAGDTGGANEPWHRHPVTHVTMWEADGNGHADYTNYSVTVASRTPTASTTATYPANDNTPFCGSCHKAHGSDVDRTLTTGHADGLIYDDGTTATIQDGSNMQQTCNICHKKG